MNNLLLFGIAIVIVYAGIRSCEYLERQIWFLKLIGYREIK